MVKCWLAAGLILSLGLSSSCARKDAHVRQAPKPAKQGEAKPTLPVALKEKIDQVEAGKADFPERARDVENMHRYVASGDFAMAAFAADQIIRKQENLRTYHRQLPPDLEEKVAQVEAGKVDFPGRDGEVDGLTRYIANGDFSMAGFVADQLIQKQRNLRNFKDSLPPDLQEKVAQIDVEKVAFPEREREIEHLNKYVAMGDFNMAGFVADQLIQKQRTLRNFRNRLPPDLEDKMAQMEAGKVDFPGRAQEIENLRSYVANGDFNMATFVANQVIQKQNNLR